MGLVAESSFQLSVVNPNPKQLLLAMHQSITTARTKQCNEPIRIKSRYMQPAPSAGKRARKSRLVLLLIGLESGTSFAGQLGSEEMQN